MKRRADEYSGFDREAAERRTFERKRRADRQAVIARKHAFLEM